MVSRWTELCVDSRDPAKVARFWAEVLGYRIIDEDDEGTAIQGDKAGPTILFIKVPEDKTVKNRLHIDVNAVDRDQDEEVERIIALGARRIDIGQGEQTWVVLADPEGNEFCVLRKRVPATGPL